MPSTLLQAIPGLSPVPWWGTLFPLAVVLTVNGVVIGAIRLIAPTGATGSSS